MSISAVFDPANWAAVPFHFWSGVFFVFGCVVGSFLNVCIHRMPLEQSVVSPPSHCPHCHYSIPWYLNIPIVTWVYLRGKCAHCGAAISPRYLLVELLTGLAFLGCWLRFGSQSVGLALVYCLVLAGLIVATFIDFEHFIIPDEITIGGIFAGVVCSFAVPALHFEDNAPASMLNSFWGILAGGGVVYAILRLGKLLFGRQKVELEPDTRILFSETSVQLPDREIPYDELFYRKSDAIAVEAKTVELPDRCYRNVKLRLTPQVLQIDDEIIDPETVTELVVVADRMLLPREAMGFGDVKFMAAIGAFTGWPGVLFSLMASSVIGAFVGVSLILLRRQQWSSRLPYGPYIALAACIWIFCGHGLLRWWLRTLQG